MELDELIASIDIVQYISQFVELTQRGDEYWGLSCFQDEKTPSFSVRPDPPVFYDYSAGVGGNVYTFTKLYYKCSNREAVEILKKYAGVEGNVITQRRHMEAALDCKKYTPKRKAQKASKCTVLQDDYMQRFEKREDKLKVWEQEGISRASLDKFQVYYDGFSDRLVYPIRSVDGKIVNVGGRTLDPKWKEKELSKYIYFQSWGTINTIYGLYENMENILEKKEIILFEGCKSVLLADTWEIHNTAAILTSHLSPNQMKILAQLGCRVVFALDKEINIRTDKNINKLNRYVNIEYIWDKRGLLKEKDSPVDEGYETFLQLYNERIRLK